MRAGDAQSREGQTLKEIGITRVSLGVENFNDKILEENGRAHLSRRRSSGPTTG